MVSAWLAAKTYLKFSRRKSRFDVAQMHFFETTLHSENSNFSFDPKTVTIERKDVDQTNGESTTCSVTIYALNESGEYSVFRSGGVYQIKHLDQNLAKIMLKNDFVSLPKHG